MPVFVDGEPVRIGTWIDANTVSWQAARIGIIPQRCQVSNKILWPFTKVGARSLTWIGPSSMYSKMVFADWAIATFENLRMQPKW